MALSDKLRNVLEGFTEKTVDRPSLPGMDYEHDGESTLITGDFEDYAEQNMIEASQSTDAGIQPHGHESEPVRLVNGALDFLGTVGEETVEWIEREMGEGHTNPVKDDPLPVLREYAVGSRAWDPQRFSVDGEMRIVRKNATRQLVRLVNLGPEVVVVDSQTHIQGGTLNGGVSLPISKLDGTGPYTPVELPICDEVWATPATAGVASVVEVYDFFGVPE
jgi:hypothetical protein